MSHIRRIPHLVRSLAAFTAAMLGVVVSTSGAFAMRVPAPGGSSSSFPAVPGPTVAHTVVASGVVGWQVAVIVVGVAVLAAIIAIAVDRARAAHRTGVVPAT